MSLVAELFTGVAAILFLSFVVYLVYLFVISHYRYQKMFDSYKMGLLNKLAEKRGIELENFRDDSIVPNQINWSVQEDLKKMVDEDMKKVKEE